MFRKLLVAVVRWLPVGVLVEALQPSLNTDKHMDTASWQISRITWFHGSRVAVRLTRKGSQQAELQVGDTRLVFDVYRQGGVLATLRIKEMLNG